MKRTTLTPISALRAWLRLLRILAGAVLARLLGYTVIYISGPMRGYPDYNYPTFAEAARALRGFEHRFYVISPAELGEVRSWVGETSWNRYMLRDIIAVCFCQQMALLAGWEGSKGANVELTVARAIGLEVRYFKSTVLGDGVQHHSLGAAPPEPDLGKVDITCTLVTRDPRTEVLVAAHPALVKKVAEALKKSLTTGLLMYQDAEAGVPPTKLSVEGPIIHASFATEEARNHV